MQSSSFMKELWLAVLVLIRISVLVSGSLALGPFMVIVFAVAITFVPLLTMMAVIVGIVALICRGVTTMESMLESDSAPSEESKDEREQSLEDEINEILGDE